MTISSRVIYETRTGLDSYQVVDEVYTGRESRLLYSGRYQTAQSGIPLDGIDKMLFEYNQRLVELINQLKPSDILLIGGGVYTLASYVHAKRPSIHFDIIEPDKELDNIAKKYFDFKVSNELHIIHDYGLSYLKKTKKLYDLIIIDAFIDQQIPEEVMSKKFAKLASLSLNQRGVLAANVISDFRSDSALSHLHGNFIKCFEYYKVFPARPDRSNLYLDNFIYVAASNSIKLKLSYPSLDARDVFT